MIWGLTLEPGKVYTEIVQDELQLSMAILECRKGISDDESNFSHIVMKTYNTEYLLCTLVNGANYQQTLDLKIMPREKVTFSVQGTRTVYLVGYSSLCPDGSHDYEMGVDQDVPGWEEDYPAEESEEHYTVQPQPVTSEVDLEDGTDVTRNQAVDDRFQVIHEEEEESLKQEKISQEAELVYTIPDVEAVKDEPSSPHADLGERLAPSGSLDPTTSGKEHHQHGGSSYQNYPAVPGNDHPSTSNWSVQTTVGPPAHNDPLFDSGQSAANLGQGTSSSDSTVYPVGVVGLSQPSASFQNFQQPPNKRQRVETIPAFPQTQETSNNSSGSQFPGHSGRVESGLRQGQAARGRRTQAAPSFGAGGPSTAAVKQSLKSLVPRGVTANKSSDLKDGDDDDGRDGKEQVVKETNKAINQESSMPHLITDTEGHLGKTVPAASPMPHWTTAPQPPSQPSPSPSLPPALASPLQSSTQSLPPQSQTSTLVPSEPSSRQPSLPSALEDQGIYTQSPTPPDQLLTSQGVSLPLEGILTVPSQGQCKLPPSPSHLSSSPNVPSLEYVKSLDKRIRCLERIVLTKYQCKGSQPNYRLVDGKAVLGCEGGPQVIVEPSVYEDLWAKSSSGKEPVLKLMPVVLPEDVMARSNYFGGAVFTGKEWVSKCSLRTYPPFEAIVYQAGIEFPGCFTTESEQRKLRDGVNGKCRRAKRC